MDVDIDLIVRHFEVEIRNGMTSGDLKTLVRIAQGACDHSVANPATVDKAVLPLLIAPKETRLADQAGQTYFGLRIRAARCGQEMLDR